MQGQIFKSLSNRQAEVLVQGALVKARQLGINISVAVVCSGGHLLHFQRMDKAKIFSIDLAVKKAYTAAITQVDTHKWEEWAKSRDLFGIESDSRLILFAGGLKVTEDNDVIGGIGVSGGTPEQDRSCCQAGITALYP
ncbi:MAG: GlcG/HbpS family heme-binding protein [Peptococcaceae bacterium]